MFLLSLNNSLYNSLVYLVGWLLCFNTWPSHALISGGYPSHDHDLVQTQTDPHKHVLPISIIDILSSTAQFSVLLRYIQTRGLVPFINESRNLTLVAPVNSAFIDVDPSLITKELLLYMLVNSTVFTASIHENITLPTCMDSPFTKNPSPVPIYMEAVAPQTIRIGGANVVEPDLNTSGYRGVVQAVDKLLEVPISVCSLLRSNSNPRFNGLISTFSRIFLLEHSCADQIIFQSLSTLLLPVDDAFHRYFSDIELKFLFSQWASADRSTIINRHILPTFLPLFADCQLCPWDVPSTVYTLDGTPLKFSRDLIINSSLTPLDTGVLASDGVVHLYDSLVLTKDASDSEQVPLVTFTPEKYMRALDSNEFVTELHFRGLGHLINQPSKEPQTILVPKASPDGDKDRVSISSKKSALYHFVQGQYNISELDMPRKSSILLTSRMSSHELGGNHQRIKLYVNESGKYVVNGRYWMDVEGYSIGNTSIYLIDGALDLPLSLSLSLGPIYHLSRSASFLERLDLIDLPNKKGWTVLIPTSSAWDNMGLAAKYLESNETSLRQLFESYIIEKPFYSDSEKSSVTLYNGKKNVQTSFDHDENSNSILTLGEAQFSVETMDVLFSGGVAHSVSQVVLPEHITVHSEHLIRASGADMFMDLLIARNLSQWLDVNGSYTILAPSDRSLKYKNITEDTNNIDLLLKLHILPSNPIEDLLDGQPVSTLAEGIHISAKEISSGLFMIQIVEGLDYEIRVLDRGNTSINKNGTISTVLQVDRFLSPDWITRPTLPPFRLRTSIAILIGFAFGVMIIFSVISCGLYVLAGRTKDQETRPLLGERRNTGTHSGAVSPPGYEDHNGYEAGSSNGTPRRHSNLSTYSAYSTHSTVAPIDAAKVQPQREHGRHLNIAGVGARQYVN